MPDLNPAAERDYLQGLLEAISAGALDVAAERAGTGPDNSDAAIVEWCEREVGIKLHTVPKVLDVFLTAIRAFRDHKVLRLAVLGPRGGGKTKLTAVIELVAYRWFGYDWQNVGGSLQQAHLCYQYIRDAHYRSGDLARFTARTQASETRSHAGGRIAVSAASQTSVRGPHPVGPSGGGGLTLDEAAIIPDDICDAAKGQLTSAAPSALIQLSTMGEKQTGRFWELLESSAAKGYTLKSFDIFDVAKRCQYDCATTCPVKQHFADDFYSGSGATRQLAHKAYCGGKAHDVDGWVDIDEIAQHWRESGPTTFERELMGRSTAVVGHVYDPRLIEEARVKGKALSKDPDQHRERFQLLEKAVGLDWGFAGECALVYVFRMRDALVTYRSEFFTRERFSKVREHLLKTCFEERIESIYADAASPNENEELSNMGAEMAEARGIDWSPRVFPVAFGKWKSYGLGEVKRRLESSLLKFAPDFGGVKDEGFDRAMRYLRAYHTGKDGMPVKVDDHYCDALLCACAGFSQSFRAQTQFVRT